MNRKPLLFKDTYDTENIAFTYRFVHGGRRDNDSTSCLDLICTDQAHVFTNAEVLPSLASHSKYNIIYDTLIFNLPRPPPYKGKIWDYISARGNLQRFDKYQMA